MSILKLNVMRAPEIFDIWGLYTTDILTDDLASRLVFQNVFPAGLVFLTFAEVLLVLSSCLLQVLWTRDVPTDYGRADWTDYQTDESDLAGLSDQDFSSLFDGENFFVLLHDQNHVLMMQLLKDFPNPGIQRPFQSKILISLLPQLHPQQNSDPIQISPHLNFTLTPTSPQPNFI